MAEKTNGDCYLCGVNLSKTAMKNHLLNNHNSEKDGQECCLLKIESCFDKNYWLYIDVPLEKTLSPIDSFLRKIWLECCGHLITVLQQKQPLPLLELSAGKHRKTSLGFWRVTLLLFLNVQNAEKPQIMSAEIVFMNRKILFTAMIA